MRRAVPLIAALAALAFPALADAASPADVIRDCTLDGRLDKTYTQKELRQALAAIPSDVDEYTNCRDVIRNAQLAAATGSSGGGTSSSGGGTTGGTSGGGGTGGGGGTSDGGASGSTAGVFGGFPSVPGDGASAATPAERAAIADAVDEVTDDDPVEEAGVGLPTPLIGALAIGALALLVFVALDIRRRLVDRRGA